MEIIFNSKNRRKKQTAAQNKKNFKQHNKHLNYEVIAIFMEAQGDIPVTSTLL